MSKLPHIPGYDELTPAKKAEICNGMGPKGSFLTRLIPNTIWGLNAVEAANRHDYRFYIGRTKEDKRNADRGFLVDLIIIINNHGGWLAVPRLFRSLTYYLIVHFFGHKAFWKNKVGGLHGN